MEVDAAEFPRLAEALDEDFRWPGVSYKSILTTPLGPRQSSQISEADLNKLLNGINAVEDPDFNPY